MAPDGAERVQVRYTHDANILTTLGKIVTNWLGNSPQVANRHYAMTMQSSFDQAVVRGAAIPGVTSAVPQNLPQSLQDKGRQASSEKTTDAENAVNDSVCLVSSLSDLSLSYPARTRT